MYLLYLGLVFSQAGEKTCRASPHAGGQARDGVFSSEAAHTKFLLIIKIILELLKLLFQDAFFFFGGAQTFH
jgi:hypothetical protein